MKDKREDKQTRKEEEGGEWLHMFHFQTGLGSENHEFTTQIGAPFLYGPAQTGLGSSRDAPSELIRFALHDDVHALWRR